MTPWADPLDRDQEAEIDCRETADAQQLRYLEAGGDYVSADQCPNCELESVSRRVAERNYKRAQQRTFELSEQAGIRTACDAPIVDRECRDQ